MPNSANSAQAPERSYTVPKNGLVTGTVTTVHSTSVNKPNYTGYFLVNNISIPSTFSYSITQKLGDNRPYDQTTTTSRYMVYVKKGDVIRYKNCYGVGFYPLR